MFFITDIEFWVFGGESASLKLKETTSDLPESAKTICDMLNHRGGWVISGFGKVRSTLLRENLLKNNHTTQQTL